MIGFSTVLIWGMADGNLRLDVLDSQQLIPALIDYFHRHPPLLPNCERFADCTGEVPPHRFIESCLERFLNVVPGTRLRKEYLRRVETHTVVVGIEHPARHALALRRFGFKSLGIKNI